MDLTTYAIPAFIALIALELFVSARAHVQDARGFEQRDSWASLAMGLGSLVVGIFTKWIWFGIYQFLFQFRFFDLGTGAWASPLVFVAALVGDDFCYYWFHRMHHEVRLFWAGHVNHHSSQYFNLTTALRQPWTTFASTLFYLPLPLLGFDPLLLITVHSANLLWQFWIHTEYVGKLGPLEWILNTPSHHRVHHGRNVQYLDRNHGGILIVWDRLFGSFEPEGERVDYGLTKNLDSHSPWKIAFHEWQSLWRDLRGARSPGEALQLLFQPPGWSPDGSTQTARELRRRLEVRAH